jgi:hypothetical protein
LNARIAPERARQRAPRPDGQHRDERVGDALHDLPGARLDRRTHRAFGRAGERERVADSLGVRAPHHAVEIDDENGCPRRVAPLELGLGRRILEEGVEQVVEREEALGHEAPLSTASAPSPG